MWVSDSPRQKHGIKNVDPKKASKSKGTPTRNLVNYLFAYFLHQILTPVLLSLHLPAQS